MYTTPALAAEPPGGSAKMEASKGQPEVQVLVRSPQVQQAWGLHLPVAAVLQVGAGGGAVQGTQAGGRALQGLQAGKQVGVQAQETL
eukprot:CAMPEP_0202895470 /NCGR_PEP_ID=MMETSP1392-20130828/4663_1 /ASSEMBLY_ACC=CAM_ASM_000868 /TAXON_ID=225041 /ORGANISM="Chlamydomonas chlamydogama, Strain SAG 11-48b" /LENGTH=86 /DNA_ID=CAMNT_0049580491 /DNA_START=270 /DNA_END=531 /DNA_ORIENTATION=-